MKLKETDIREMVREELVNELNERDRNRMYKDRKYYHKEWALIEYDINEAVLNIFFDLQNRDLSTPGQLRIRFKAAVGMDPVNNGSAAELSYVGIREGIPTKKIDLNEEQEAILVDGYKGNRKEAIMKVLKDLGELDIFKMIERRIQKGRLTKILKKSW